MVPRLRLQHVGEQADPTAVQASADFFCDGDYYSSKEEHSSGVDHHARRNGGDGLGCR